MRNSRMTATIGAMLVIASAASAYQNPDYHVSISAPSGWIEASPDQANDLAAQASGSRVLGPHYLTMFKPDEPSPPKAVYALVQGEVKTVMLDQVEREVRELNRNAAKIPNTLPLTPTIRSSKLDRDKRRIITEMDLTMPGNPMTLHCTTYTTIGKEALVHVHCYAPLSSVATYQTQFAALADSLSFDKEYQYADSSLGAVGSGAVNGAFIGAGVGAVIGVLVYITRKKTV